MMSFSKIFGPHVDGGNRHLEQSGTYSVRPSRLIARPLANASPIIVGSETVRARVSVPSNV
jgi:hypothetical protein